MVKATMADLLDRCPEELQMVLIDQMAEPLLAEPSPRPLCGLRSAGVSKNERVARRDHQKSIRSRERP